MFLLVLLSALVLDVYVSLDFEDIDVVVVVSCWLNLWLVLIVSDRLASKLLFDD